MIYPNWAVSRTAPVSSRTSITFLFFSIFWRVGKFLQRQIKSCTLRSCLGSSSSIYGGCKCWVATQQSISCQFQLSIFWYWPAPLLSPFCDLLCCVQLDPFSSRCMVLQAGGEKKTDVSKEKHSESNLMVHSGLFHLHFSSGCWLFFHEPWSCSRARNTTKEMSRRRSVKREHRFPNMTWIYCVKSD